MARITIELSEEGKRKLKAKCAEQGKTMTQVIAEFCEKFVEEQNKKGEKNG